MKVVKHWKYLVSSNLCFIINSFYFSPDFSFYVTSSHHIRREVVVDVFLSKQRVQFN